MSCTISSARLYVTHNEKIGKFEIDYDSVAGPNKGGAIRGLSTYAAHREREYQISGYYASIEEEPRTLDRVLHGVPEWKRYVNDYDEIEEMDFQKDKKILISQLKSIN